MSALVQEVSELTDLYQTTAPSGVCKQLKLGEGDQIRYCTEPNWQVYIELVRAAEGDPAFGAFLDSIDTDLKAHPEHLKAFTGALQDRLVTLVGGMDVNLDVPLSPEDE